MKDMYLVEYTRWSAFGGVCLVEYTWWSILGGIYSVEYTWWSTFRGIHLVEYTRWNTLGGVHSVVEYTWWSVGIQVSCSAEDHSAVRDGRSPVSKYSRTSLYIAGHLPHLKAIKQPSHHIHHTFQHGVHLLEYTCWSILGGVYSVEYTRWNTLGVVYLVEYTRWKYTRWKYTRRGTLSGF